MRRSLVIAIIVVVVLITALAFLYHVTTPAPAPAPPLTPAAPPVSPQQADLILDLFEPDSGTLANQHSEATIAAQLEHAMVVSFLLTHCNLLDRGEYADAYNAFIRYAVQSHYATGFDDAAARMKTIASSASASYSLVYSRVPCTDPSLPPLVDQLKNWIKKIP